MKKNFKRTLAKVMAVALTVSMVGTAADADAAKKIKLSKKSITVTKGKSKKVTIKNVKAKKVKKLTVKTTNKKVATVKKAGKTAFKVTGKKVGSAKIKVTLKIKGKKKATKLTLKVTVKKATDKKDTTPTAAATVAPTAAPTAAATDAAPATTAPVESEEPAPVPVLEDLVLSLTKENAPEWATDGTYNNAVFNEDGTISYITDFAAPNDKGEIGDVYNNGIAFFVGGGEKTDLSAYKYVAVTIATDAEMVLLTWAGGADPTNFWDKKDTWNGSVATIDNGDGTKTVYYEAASVFSKVEKAFSIGFALKATDYVGDYTGEEPYATKTAELKSIVLTQDEIPVPPATPEATENPFTEGGIMLDLAAAYNADLSDVEIKAAQDADGYATTEFLFDKNNQRVFFNLPADVDASQIAKIEVVANVPGKLCSSLFQNDFTKDGEWWNAAKKNGYPFYAGSGERAEDGGLVARGIELNALDTSAAEITGMGGFFSLGVNGAPDDGFGEEPYYVYGINIVLKDVTETPVVPEDETPEVETPVVPEEETPEVETPVVPEDETPEVETPVVPEEETPEVETPVEDVVEPVVLTETASYEFVPTYGNYTNVFEYALSEEEIAALTAAEAVKLAASLTLTDTTGSLQVGVADDEDNCHWFFSAGNATETAIKYCSLAEDELSSTQYENNAVAKDAIKKLVFRTADAGFTGSVALTKIELLNSEDSGIGSFNIEDADNSDASVGTWKELTTLTISSEYDLTKFASVKVEATVSGSDMVLLAAMTGTGTTDGTASDIVDGVANITIPEDVVAGEEYTIVIKTKGVAGFNGSVDVTKVTLVPAE